MSQLLSLARRSGQPTLIIDELTRAAEAGVGTSLEFVFRMWIGDNYRAEGEWEEAITTYRAIVKEAVGAAFLGEPITPRVLEYIADCHQRLGDTNQAVEALESVTRTPVPNTSLAYTWYTIGTLLENDGQFDRAKLAFVTAVGAAEPRPVPGADWRDLARRALARMVGEKSAYFHDGQQLVRKLKRAVKQRDGATLRSLASKTNFHVGGAACDGWMTEGDGYIDAFVSDLEASANVTVLDEFDGCGEKQTLFSHGWDGKTFVGSVFLFIERCAYGWSWTGVGVAFGTESLAILHQQQSGIAPKSGNQPLQLSIKAPWPKGQQNFAAGGYRQFLPVVIAVGVGAIVVFAAAIAALLALAGPFAVVVVPIITELLTAFYATVAVSAALAIAAIVAGLTALAQQLNLELNLFLGLIFGATIIGWLAIWPASWNPCGFGVRGFFYNDPNSHYAVMSAHQDSRFAIDFTRNTPGVPFANSADGELVLAVADGIVLYGDFRNANYSTTANFIEIVHVDRTQFAEFDRIFANDSSLTRARQAGLIGSNNDPRTGFKQGLDAVRQGERPPPLRNGLPPPPQAISATNIGRLRYRRSTRRDPTSNAESLPRAWDPGDPPDPSGRGGTPGQRRDVFGTLVPSDDAAHLGDPADPNYVNLPTTEQGGFGSDGQPLDPNDPDTHPTSNPARQRRVPELRPAIPEFGRYSSRYMHMQPTAFVSLFQLVFQGAALAKMGSTGTSAVAHLHLEIHDAFLKDTGVNDPLGDSVRITPLDVDPDGVDQELLEANDGRCIHSTNVLYP